MSDQKIDEITGEKKGKETMAAWAAVQAMREQRQQAKAPEQENSGGGSPRTNTSQRPQKIKTVTKTQESKAPVQKDQVDLARSEKSQDEVTMKDAQALVRGRKASAPAKPAAPAPVKAQAPAEQSKKVIEQAALDEVAKEAEVVTAEEVQSAPSVATTVAAKSVKSAKKSSKADKTESTSSTSESDEIDEDAELAELVKPGNGTRASAYLPASELMNGDDENHDLDDFLVAL